jgi:hypothetical protein
LCRDQGDKRLLDLTFFRQNPILDPENLAKIRYRDIYQNGPVLFWKQQIIV